MEQSHIQEQLKDLSTVLDGLEKDAKQAIVFAIDAIQQREVEDIRAKIAQLPD